MKIGLINLSQKSGIHFSYYDVVNSKQLLTMTFPGRPQKRSWLFFKEG